MKNGKKHPARGLGMDNRGGLLIETLVALAIFSLLGFAVLNATQTSYISKGRFETDSIAENLLRNQMEAAFAEAYRPPGQSYASVPAPEGFTVTAEALVYDAESTAVELIRVTVYRQGQVLKTLETVRALR